MKPINVTDTTFKQEVLDAKGPVLVDFWAPWCVPCRSLIPVIEELAEEYDGRAKICKLNTEENRQVSQLMNIRSIPTIAVFLDGKVYDVIVGARPKRNFVKSLDAALKKSKK